MLSIAQIGSDPSYYTSLASERYYLESGEPPGVWLESPATRRLDLHGKVTGQALHNLLQGKSPDGRGNLTRNVGRPDRRPGWDLTFSAPKSVSIACALAPKWVRNEIEAAHFQAIRHALSFIQREVAVSRQGAGGADQSHPQGLLAALFEQSSSRNGDIQLHTHCVVPNVCLRQDGSTGTISQQPLYRYAHAVGALYRAELSHQLEMRLGFSSRRIERGLFELAGFPQNLIEACSTRRAEIEELLRSLGSHDSKTADYASLKTRSAKNKELSRFEVFLNTRRLCKEHGFTSLDLLSLCAANRTIDRLANAQEAFSEAIITLTSGNESHFSKRELLRAAAAQAPGRSVGAEMIEAVVNAAISDPQQLVPLRHRKGELHYTTPTILRLETHLIEIAKELAQTRSHYVQADTVNAVIAERPALSDKQAKALRAITAPHGLALVWGLAGAGKTFMLEAAKECWERSGFQVVGAALQGKAAQGLQNDTGIPSQTLHQMLYQINQAQKRNQPALLTSASIVVVDEAGMVETGQFRELLFHVRRAGAKIILAGDHLQLQPIGMGGALAGLLARLDAAVKLTDIIRQQQPWARKAVKQFAAGKTETALAAYAGRGLVDIQKTKPQAIKALITAWAKEGVKRPEENLIFAHLRAERKELNLRAQRARLVAGELSAEKSIRINDAYFFEGDRILFTRNSKALGVKNGHLGTVAAINPAGPALVVRLDSGKQVAFSPQFYDHVDHGYALTTYKGQGVTVQNSFLLVGGFMQSRESTYVQASRSRNLTRFFTHELEAGDDLKEMVYSMSRSRKKELALDVLEHDEFELDHLLYHKLEID